jgi:hypothetical protein
MGIVPMSRRAILVLHASFIHGREPVLHLAFLNHSQLPLVLSLQPVREPHHIAKHGRILPPNPPPVNAPASRPYLALSVQTAHRGRTLQHSRVYRSSGIWYDEHVDGNQDDAGYWFW